MTDLEADENDELSSQVVSDSPRRRKRDETRIGHNTNNVDEL